MADRRASLDELVENALERAYLGALSDVDVGWWRTQVGLVSQGDSGNGPFYKKAQFHCLSLSFFAFSCGSTALTLPEDRRWP